ncbi:MAG: outer membrane beta-barrel protein [Gammaproteobacteria bacterium]|nr:outer membrane beta-barrel protein [Gammaproteobacteria bacterium]
MISADDVPHAKLARACVRPRWPMLLSLLAIAVTFLVPSSPIRAAQGENGIYVDLSLGGGAQSGLGASDGFTTELFPGPAVSGAIGYQWRQLRIEGSLFYTLLPLDGQTGPDGMERERPPPACFLCGTSSINGNLSALALMVTAYLDLDLGDSTRLYLGGGAGTARVAADYEFDALVVGFPTDESISFIDDSDNVLAYQVRVGLSFDVTDSSEFYLGYRYFATDDQTFNVEGGGRLEQDGLGMHIGELGYRLHF